MDGQVEEEFKGLLSAVINKSVNESNGLGDGRSFDFEELRHKKLIGLANAFPVLVLPRAVHRVLCDPEGGILLILACEDLSHEIAGCAHELGLFTKHAVQSDKVVVVSARVVLRHE